MRQYYQTQKKVKFFELAFFIPLITFMVIAIIILTLTVTSQQNQGPNPIENTEAGSIDEEAYAIQGSPGADEVFTKWAPGEVTAIKGKGGKIITNKGATLIVIRTWIGGQDAKTGKPTTGDWTLSPNDLAKSGLGAINNPATKQPVPIKMICNPSKKLTGNLREGADYLNLIGCPSETELDLGEGDDGANPSPGLGDNKRGIKLGANKNAVTGAGGDDYIIGNKNIDHLCGGEGDDKLFGKAGKDLLRGSTGKDDLTGGNDEGDKAQGDEETESGDVPYDLCAGGKTESKKCDRDFLSPPVNFDEELLKRDCPDIAEVGRAPEDTHVPEGPPKPPVGGDEPPKPA